MIVAAGHRGPRLTEPRGFVQGLLRRAGPIALPCRAWTLVSLCWIMRSLPTLEGIACLEQGGEGSLEGKRGERWEVKFSIFGLFRNPAGPTWVHEEFGVERLAREQTSLGSFQDHLGSTQGNP